MSKFVITGWKSCAMWPVGKICLDNVQNITEDTHADVRSASNVCSMLAEQGFGGDRKIFPIATWIVPVIEEEVLKDKTYLAEWNFIPAEGSCRDSWSYDSIEGCLAFITLHSNGKWCIRYPAISDLITTNVEELKKLVEQHFAK